MSKTVQMTQSFDVPPKVLYNLYMKADQHAAATGWKVKISKKVGDRFTSGDGWIRGKTLHLVPFKMIVQTWRGKDWDKAIPDSVLTIRFDADGDGTKVTLVHALVPEDSAKSIREGWRNYYFKRWRAYLKAQG